ncbi:MAG TPA: hypothetical protein PKK93_03895 [Bacteroidales bacterium]|jgi:hypothetical protein|nr:MAG: hypothetical protein BWY89_01760 [Bacteroidetes bacterium ADurb.BinA012]HNY57278.1 hypothetical protein [Bacteroidales bacterium]HOH14602.1 hypothetical protein [Bacteroidales bacterium]HPV26300.1 hypothetical protein [Bacteroidales bacterium]
MKKILAMAFCLVMAATATGQIPVTENAEGETPPVNQRLFFGGSFGLQFGTVTNIKVAPLAGIWLLPRIAAGAGPTFQYYKDPFGRTSIYGGRAMLQLTLIQNLNNIIPIGLNTGIYVNGEYEALSLQRAFFTSDPDAIGRIWHGTFLAGAGLSQPTGRRSSMNISFLWSITGNEYGIYDTPEIRIEFYF